MKKLFYLAITLITILVLMFVYYRHLKIENHDKNKLTVTYSYGLRTGDLAKTEPKKITITTQGNVTMSLDNAKAPKKSLKLSNKNKDELLDFIINSKIINLKDSLISNKCDDDTESTLILAFENKSYTYEEYCTNNDIYNKVESKIRSIVGKENILDYENSIKEFYNEEYFRNKNYATRN